MPLLNIKIYASSLVFTNLLSACHNVLKLSIYSHIYLRWIFLFLVNSRIKLFQFFFAITSMRTYRRLISFCDYLCEIIPSRLCASSLSSMARLSNHLYLQTLLRKEQFAFHKNYFNYCKWIKKSVEFSDAAVFRKLCVLLSRNLS